MRNKKSISLILILTILPTLIFIYFRINTNNVPNLDPQRSNTETNILSSTTPKDSSTPLPESETVTGFNIGTHRLVIIEFPQKPSFYVESSEYEEPQIVSIPYLIDFDSNELDVTTYQVQYFEKSDKKSSDSPYIADSKLLNVDSDPDQELVTTWIIPEGGSHKLQSIVVFDLVDNHIIPISFLPLWDPDTQNMVFTNTKTQKKYYTEITMSNYGTDIKDLNNDGLYELLFYPFDWEGSYYDPHYWTLFVFSIINGEADNAIWWNKGKELKTAEKLIYTDTDKIMSYFNNQVNK